MSFIILLIFGLIYSLFDFVLCSLFKEKRFNSILILDCILGILILLIYNCTVVPVQVHHHLCKSIKTIEQNCTDFVLV